MDKIAANNHIVTLGKEVKKAKAMVAGNLIRRIGKLKQEKEKTQDEAQQRRIGNKIENIYSETKLIKTLDPYPICKKVTLNPDVKHWTNVISDSKSTAEERLGARVVCKNNVQKCVAGFRNDHKDCDEWLEEYFEFREKKKELEGTSKKHWKKSRHSEAGAYLDKSDEHRAKRAQHSRKKDRTPRRNTQDNKKSSFFNDESNASNNEQETEELHPSWASKRKEKELLKAALSGQVPQSRRIVLNSD